MKCSFVRKQGIGADTWRIAILPPRHTVSSADLALDRITKAST
jgi:hypothetical protein